MGRIIEDNTISVLQRAIKYFQIPVTKNSVKESLKSNPYYPTLKSICDVLKEWDIDHYPLKYTSEEIMDLPAPYLVHLNINEGQIVFVSEIKNGKVIYYDSFENKRESDFKRFLEWSSGVVILLNPNEKSGEKQYRKKKQEEIIANYILPFTILSAFYILSFSALNSFIFKDYHIEPITYLLLLTKAVGLILSFFLILQEFEVHFSFTDKICHFNKTTNCNKVINDKVSKVFGWIGWADIGFLYFTTCLIFILQGLGPSYYSLLAILSGLTLPYPIFSIYYQGFIIRKWCPLCLGVQFILMLEFILLMPQFSKLILTLESVTLLILIILVTGVIYFLFILYIREKITNKRYYYKFLSFLKNQDVFRVLLFNQKHYDIPITSTSLVFGDKNAPIQITSFLSLQCSHCARAFSEIKEILNSGFQATFNIVLVTSDSKIFNVLYYHTINNRSNALNILEQCFEIDPSSRSKLIESLEITEIIDISKEVNCINKKLFIECNVKGTPTFFINGYKLPNLYNVADIKYFIQLFPLDNELSAEQVL